MDVNANSGSALLLAVWSFDMQQIIQLMERGATTNITPGSLLEKAIKRQPSKSCQPRKSGQSSQSIDILRLLLRTIDINVDNGIALKTAATYRYYDIMNFLLTNGADVYCDNGYVIKMITRRDDITGLQILLDNNIDKKYLADAVLNNEKLCVRIMTHFVENNYDICYATIIDKIIHLPVLDVEVDVLELLYQILQKRF